MTLHQIGKKNNYESLFKQVTLVTIIHQNKAEKFHPSPINNTDIEPFRLIEAIVNYFFLIAHKDGMGRFGQILMTILIAFHFQIFMLFD